MKNISLQGAFIRITLVLFVLLTSFATLHAQTAVVSIDAGGAASGSYIADADFSGGATSATTATINTANVTSPAPQAVYQTQRYGNFTYTIPGFTAGTTYTVRLHFAETYWTAAGDRTFNVLINGTQVLTNFDMFATAGGENIAVVEPFNAVANASGQIVIQFVSVVDNAAVNGIEIESVAAAGGPYGGTPAAIPGTVMNENYDTGGQGVAYNVTAVNGTDNAYRSDGVDLELAAAPATGNDVGWSAAGQWFKYTVNVATAGTYTVSFLVANGSGAAVTDGFHLSNSSGTNLSGSVAVPNTGGWQTWSTVTASVTLPAGTQTLTLNQDNGGWNINSMAFAAQASSCTSAPSAPSGLAASGISSSGTTLSWTADTAPANCSISSYTVLENGTSIGTATGTSFAVSGLTASTTYNFTVESTDAAGTSPASSAVSVTTSGSGGGEGPYGGTPAAIAGTVMAENYDTGGQGIAYNVTAVNGSDNAYRSDGVDLELATAPATGNDVGWSAAGQWFKYTVNVSTAGTYTVSFLVANGSGAAVADAFHISNSLGTNLTGSVAVPSTGGWQTWSTVTATVTLPAGVQTLTLNQDNGGWNINSFTFVFNGGSPFGGNPAAVPGTVMNENYDTGGQGVAYNVTAVNGSDNAYRTDGVDLELASSPATGNDVGWSAAGQWFKYTVNVSTSGTYTVSFLVANGSGAAVTDAFHISNSAGTNLTGSVAVPSTGGWQAWTTVTASVTLSAGTQTLTLNQDAGGWNIDSMDFASGSGGGGCTSAPSAPTGLAASGTSSSGTTLSWTADTAPANCSISNYTVLENGTSIGTATGTSFTVSGLTASTSYSFTVEATDAAGTSPASSAVSVTTSGTGGGGYVPIANGAFTLAPQNAPGLLLDDSNYGVGAGNPLDVLTPNGSVSQAWSLSSSGVTPAGYYNLAAMGPYCMTASGTTSGSAAVLDGCAGTTAQAWEAVASGSFYVFHPANNTALCLTATGSGSGNAVDVDTCSGGTNQEWGLAVSTSATPPPQGPITNGGYSLIPQNAPGLMLDDSGSGTGAGNPINVTTPASSVAQNWALSDNGVSPLTYYNFATIGAYCMTASGTTSGSAVVLDPCAGTTGQSWQAVASGSSYTFSPANNTALCLTASGTASGSGVVVENCSGGTNQEWALGPVAAPSQASAAPNDCVTYGVPNQTVGGTTYAPTWCTEFNTAAGPAPTAGYAYDLGNNGGWGNNEVEIYCGPPGYPTNPAECPTTFSTSTAPVYIDGNGHLVIQPTCTGGFVNGACSGSWLSARLVTSNSATGGNTFQYGMIEASIELQDMTPQGLWPAFWGLGDNIYSGVTWPTCGETDILEDWSPSLSLVAGGGDTAINSTVHTAKTGGNGFGGRYTFPSGQAVNTGFHTYGMIWSQNQVQYFVDDPSTPFLTVTPESLPAGDTWPFNQPIFFILNEAIGGLLGGTPPTAPVGPMLVDYVRYYVAQ